MVLALRWKRMFGVRDLPLSLYRATDEDFSCVDKFSGYFDGEMIESFYNDQTDEGAFLCHACP
jgi:hypothetical protein